MRTKEAKEQVATITALDAGRARRDPTDRCNRR
jgi:hypothetical protein